MAILLELHDMAWAMRISKEGTKWCFQDAKLIAVKITSAIRRRPQEETIVAADCPLFSILYFSGQMLFGTGTIRILIKVDQMNYGRGSVLEELNLQVSDVKKESL